MLWKYIIAILNNFIFPRSGAFCKCYVLQSLIVNMNWADLPLNELSGNKLWNWQIEVDWVLSKYPRTLCVNSE